MAMNHTYHAPTFLVVALLIAMTAGLGADKALGQQADRMEQLQPVEINPPASDRRLSSSQTGRTSDGFGTDQPVPSGVPFSDYPLTPGEVVSATRTTANLATVHSAVGIVENRGIQTQGATGLTEMLQRQPGVWAAPMGNGNPFDSAIVIRGFSNESTNRVALLVDGRNLDIPRQEANTNFFFPEIIDRIEVLRGDGTVQFGNKAIGGAVNVILKKPRQNPGLYFGVEAGSWHTDREWAAANLVRGTLAAGIFLGRYFQEGWRVYQGNGIDIEPVARPGPWSLYNLTASVNWKVAPTVTLDFMYTRTDARVPTPDWIPRPQWERRDLRDFQRATRYDNGPDERWDSVSILKLYYEGGRLGDLEIIGSSRGYDRRSNTYAEFQPSDTRWQDFGLSLKYYRKDEYGFFSNDVTLGSDLYDGRFRREARYPVLATDWPPYNNIEFRHAGQQSGYRETISYYAIDTVKLWERIVLGLGYRVETYDLRDLYANNETNTVTNAQQSLQHKKSASQWSLGFIYDRELGSSVYYKHSRMYRFANFDDMVNYGLGWPPSFNPPFWPLEPEEGTLEEVGIRHWFNRNIYASVIYYELDMDNEILYGADLNGNQRNVNVRDVSHSGLEFDGFVRITPRWTVRGNYTRQQVIVRSNFRPGFAGLTTEDKWLWQNPADMGAVSLEYQNRDWGLTTMISYNYLGSRFRINDPFNETEPLEPVKWADLAVSQTLFDGLATVYFGVKNFSDRQNATWGTRSDPSYVTVPAAWYPDAGRTYYLGVKSAMDFENMRVPTTADLRRMNNRLYGLFRNGTDTVGAMAGRLWGLVR